MFLHLIRAWIGAPQRLIGMCALAWALSMQKAPLGVYCAQGQNFPFILNLGSGFRYNFSPRYATPAGLNWMHISNANLSAPQYSNYGINMFGPVIGIDVRVRRHSRHQSTGQ